MNWKDIEYAYMGRCPNCHQQVNIKVFTNAEHKLLKEVCTHCNHEHIVRPAKSTYNAWFPPKQIERKL